MTQKNTSLKLMLALWTLRNTCAAARLGKPPSTSLACISHVAFREMRAISRILENDEHFQAFVATKT